MSSGSRWKQVERRHGWSLDQNAWPYYTVLYIIGKSFLSFSKPINLSYHVFPFSTFTFHLCVSVYTNIIWISKATSTGLFCASIQDFGFTLPLLQNIILVLCLFLCCCLHCGDCIDSLVEFWVFQSYISQSWRVTIT